MESVQYCYSQNFLQEFFKVFMQKTGSSILRIPKSFNKFFNGTTPCEVALIDQNRNSWDICLEKIEDRLVFKNGWQQFAWEKRLEEGDFLIFGYDGKSTFYVKIFSKTGCRKDAANCGKVAPIVIMDENPDQSSSKKIQRARKRKHSPPDIKINEKPDSKGPSEGAQRKSKRVKEENGNHDEKKVPGLANRVPLKNPNFVVYFSRWKLHRVEVPKEVLKQWNIRLLPKMSMRDENNKLWPVSIITADNGRHYLSNGWSDFRQSHNIREGHRCDFQLVIGKANLVQELLVHVHPASECS